MALAINPNAVYVRITQQGKIRNYVEYIQSFFEGMQLNEKLNSGSSIPAGKSSDDMFRKSCDGAPRPAPYSPLEASVTAAGADIHGYATAGAAPISSSATTNVLTTAEGVDGEEEGNAVALTEANAMVMIYGEGRATSKVVTTAEVVKRLMASKGVRLHQVTEIGRAHMQNNHHSHDNDNRNNINSKKNCRHQEHQPARDRDRMDVDSDEEHAIHEDKLEQEQEEEEEDDDENATPVQYAKSFLKVTLSKHVDLLDTGHYGYQAPCDSPTSGRRRKENSMVDNGMIAAVISKKESSATRASATVHIRGEGAVEKEKDGVFDGCTTLLRDDKIIAPGASNNKLPGTKTTKKKKRKSAQQTLQNSVDAGTNTSRSCSIFVDGSSAGGRTAAVAVEGHSSSISSSTVNNNNNNSSTSGKNKRKKNSVSSPPAISKRSSNLS